jgi:hypothetical protein
MRRRNTPGYDPKDQCLHHIAHALALTTTLTRQQLLTQSLVPKPCSLYIFLCSLFSVGTDHSIYVNLLRITESYP